MGISPNTQSYKEKRTTYINDVFHPSPCTMMSVLLPTTKSLRLCGKQGFQSLQDHSLKPKSESTNPPLV